MIYRSRSCKRQNPNAKVNRCICMLKKILATIPASQLVLVAISPILMMHGVLEEKKIALRVLVSSISKHEPKLNRIP